MAQDRHRKYHNWSKRKIWWGPWEKKITSIFWPYYYSKTNKTTQWIANKVIVASDSYNYLDHHPSSSFCSTQPCFLAPKLQRDLSKTTANSLFTNGETSAPGIPKSHWATIPEVECPTLKELTIIKRHTHRFNLEIIAETTLRACQGQLRSSLDSLQQGT